MLEPTPQISPSAGTALENSSPLGPRAPKTGAKCLYLPRLLKRFECLISTANAAVWCSLPGYSIACVYLDPVDGTL